MEFKTVTAIIPDLSLEKVEKELMKIGVPDLYISTVHGYGNYKNYFKKDCMEDCIRLEIFCKADVAKEIATTIQSAIHIGLKSDGFIAIKPVDEFINISK